MKDITKFIIILIILQSKLFSKEQTLSITCSFQNYILIDWFVDYEYNKKECNNHKITFRIPDKRNDNITNQFIDLKIDRELGMKILNKYYDNYVGELPQYTEDDLYEKIVYKLRDKFLQSEFIFKFKESTCILGSEKEKYLELLSVVPNNTTSGSSKLSLNKSELSNNSPISIDDIIPLPFVKIGQDFDITKDSVWRFTYNLTQILVNKGLDKGGYRNSYDPLGKYVDPTTPSKQLNYYSNNRNIKNDYDINYIFFDDDGLGGPILFPPYNYYGDYIHQCARDIEKSGEIYNSEIIRCNIRSSFFSTNIYTDTLLFPRPEVKNGTIRDSLTFGSYEFGFLRDKLFMICYRNHRMNVNRRTDLQTIRYTNQIVNTLNKRFGKPRKLNGWNRYNGELIEYRYNVGNYDIVLNGYGKGPYKGQNYPFVIDRIVYIQKTMEDESVKLFKQLLKSKGYYPQGILPYDQYIIKE